MRLKFIIISLLFLLFAIVAVQNVEKIDFKFLIWSFPPQPLIVMLVVVFIFGLVIGLISCSLYERKKKKQEAVIQKKIVEKDNISNKTPIK